MPRPPVLPVVDWKSVLEAAKPYEQWLAEGEFPENCEKMEQSRSELPVEPQVEAWLGSLTRPVHVLAFAEDWCGDVVRHVPVLQRFADLCPKLNVRYTARDAHPQEFARFLTNGGEAVPKFVFFSESFVECGNWGPMQYAARELIARGKACGDVATARRKVAQLYEVDGQKRFVQKELLDLIECAACLEP